MTMTLIQAVQEVCDRIGLDSPSTVIGNTDDGVRQLKGLANKVVSDIGLRGEVWPAVRKQATFVTVAAEQQTNAQLSVLCANGFQYIIPDTIYNRTTRVPLFGPRSAQLWQLSAALPYSGPLYNFRIMNDYIYMQPAPPAGHTIAFEWSTAWLVQAAGGGVFKPRFTVDTDVFLLDENLLLTGLEWHWKQQKGLPYAEDQRLFESMLAQNMGNSGTKAELSLSDQSAGQFKPGIFVPVGNWNVP